MDIWKNPSATEAEKVKLEQSGLSVTAIIRNGLPLTKPSKTIWSVGPYLLAGELAYYALFIWWILTLIYARKLWPKPDGSRCPNCNYETVGLTTPTCPECGNDLPSPRETRTPNNLSHPPRTHQEANHRRGADP